MGADGLGEESESIKNDYSELRGAFNEATE